MEYLCLTLEIIQYSMMEVSDLVSPGANAYLKVRQVSQRQGLQVEEQ